MNSIFKILPLTLILSGCGSVKHTLGLDHSAPNEFAVNDAPPLSVPNDYDLRPPMTKEKIDAMPHHKSETAKDILDMEHTG